MNDDRYRGSLPGLNWLSKKNPEGAVAVAKFLQSQTAPKLGPMEPEEVTREIRPGVGELMKAASDAFRPYVRDGVQYVGKGLRRISGLSYRDPEWQFLGDLVFYRGALTEWGVTKAGRKLRPRDDIRGVGKQKRSPGLYLGRNPLTPSPMDAEGIRTPMSGECAIPAMYDPLPRRSPTEADPVGRFGVEESRAMLAKLMETAPPITRCPTAVAKNAYFLGGISRPKAGARTGTIGAWEAPDAPKGEFVVVMEEVAAGGDLKSIGVCLGYASGYADQAGKRALLEVSKTLLAANDNKKKNVAA